MDGALRRPRTRGGRGVRGGRNTSLLVSTRVVVDELVGNKWVAVRGTGGGSRSDARGVRGPYKRPGFSSINELHICDINELPKGRGLETPLHPKKMRIWQPSPPVLPPHSTPTQGHLEMVAGPSVYSLPPSPATSGCGTPASSMPSGSSEPPSPAMPSDSSSSSTSPSVHFPRPHPHQSLDNSIDFALVYGSEDSSDEDDGEETVAPMVPRTYRTTERTPTEEDGDDNPNAPTSPANWAPSPADIGATLGPQGLYDFEWRDFPNHPILPKSRRETFSNINVGPTTPCVDPYDIFVAIWDRQFMEHIASETNRYAQQVAAQMLHDNNLHPNSRIGKWYDTTADELYVYFAVIIVMGIVVKSRQEEYWSDTPDIFYTPGFSAYISRNRFCLLSRCLHFNNNKYMCAVELSASEAKLFKIQPILTHLNQKFQNMYNLSQNISLDESLLQWKGWLDINQIIPNKAATVGIKSYEICESQTGYLWRFEISAQKKSPPQQVEDPLKASTPSLVLRLVHGLENKGHTLWMDNFYNSPSLARHLKSIGIDCVGTLRTNRQFVPPALHSLQFSDMRPGQITGLTSGDVDVMVWRDRNRVSMISTYHGNATMQLQGFTKPILILDYNIMMGGVDKKDQMLAMYPIERKRTKVWYKKLFRRLLNISVLNSYIIHRHSSNLSHRNFRMNLVRSLLSKHHPISSLETRPILPIQKQKKVDISHRLEEHPFGPNKVRKRQICKICKKKMCTFCVGCNKPVCRGACFISLHK